MGARFFPVLFIVIFHYHEWFGYTGWYWIDLFVVKGYLWVDFFFALSGFILYYVYGRRLAARISRIYPLQLMTLLAVLCLELDRRLTQARPTGLSIFQVPPAEGRSTLTFLSNLLMVQAWNIDTDLTWNPPAWFVSAEFLLYLLCPLLMLTVGTAFGWRSLALAMAGVVLLLIVANTSGRGLDVSIHNGIFRGLAEFSIGLSLGALFVALRERGTAGWSPRVCTAAQLGVLTAIVAGYVWSGPARTQRDLMVALPIVALPFVLAFDRGLLAELLHASWLRILGKWAFAIYMVHFVVLVGMFTAKVISASWPGLVGGTGSCILMGGLTWRFVEQPVGEVMRRRFLRLLNLESRDR